MMHTLLAANATLPASKNVEDTRLPHVLHINLAGWLLNDLEAHMYVNKIVEVVVAASPKDRARNAYTRESRMNNKQQELFSKVKVARDKMGHTANRGPSRRHQSPRLVYKRISIRVYLAYYCSVNAPLVTLVHT